MKVSGRKIAKEIYIDLSRKIVQLEEENIIPHLVIILLGNDAASKAYIRQKIRRGTELGIKVTFKRFPKHTSWKTLQSFITKHNEDPLVHGIIVQRPVPAQIDIEELNKAVVPEKDIDGFHPNSNFEPPLALAVMRILEEIYYKQTDTPVVSSVPFVPTALFKQWLTTKSILFLGQGEAGGKPVISFVAKHKIPHRILHSKSTSAEIEKYTKAADIIVSAVGKEHIVNEKLLKMGVILIGVGLHRSSDNRLSGDYDEEAVKDVASYYTPTPGGVGPVNVAMLLSNLVSAV